MITISVFIVGLLIGSFLNVCIYRIPRGESINYPPSHCAKCGKKIKAYDLIPLVSYVFLKGKCRYCKEKISLRYPIIELTTGVLFGALYINFGFELNFFKFAFLSALLLVIGIIDYETTDVYFNTTLTGIISGIFFTGIGYFTNDYTISGILNSIYGAAFAGGIIALIILLTKGMGWGDFEICLICGTFLGFRLAIILLFLSFVLGGSIGIVLILTGKKSRKDYIPFGPFIALACIITIFVGEILVNWYLSSLLF